MAITQYLQPESLEDALDAVASADGDVHVIAGGTVVMPLVNEGRLVPSTVVGLRRAGLDSVDRDDRGVTIGATATLTRVAGLDDAGIVSRAAAGVGGWAVRNMGTLGGNLAVFGDLGAPLLALDARVHLAGPAGRRTVALADLYGDAGNGAGVQPGELVTAVTVPPARGRTDYHRMGRVALNTPAVVSVAVRVVRDGPRVTDARVALGAAGPRPLRATRAEQTLAGSDLDDDVIAEAAAAAAADARPATDAVASEWYRRRMVGVQVTRALQRLAAQEVT